MQSSSVEAACRDGMLSSTYNGERVRFPAPAGGAGFDMELGMDLGMELGGVEAGSCILLLVPFISS